MTLTEFQANTRLQTQVVGRLWSSIPWLLFLFCWAVLFPVYDQFGSASYPYDDQFLATVVQDAQAGDIVNKIALSTVGLVGAFLLVRYRRRLGIHTTIAAVLFLFWVWGSLSPLWSIDSALSIRRLGALFFVMSFSAGMAMRVNASALLVFIATFPAIGLVAGAVYEALKGRFQPFNAAYRFCGTAPHPNVEGAFLSISTVGLCWLCFRMKGRSRNWLFVATATVGSFLWLTRSRTSLLAVAGALAFSLLIVILRDYKRIVPVAIACFCLFVAGGTLMNLAFSADSIKSPVAAALHRKDDEGGPTTLSGRVDLWKSLVPYFRAQPILGYGFDSFWTPTRIEDVSKDQEWIIGQAHSGYFDMLLSLGIPGAVFYSTLLVYCIGWSTYQFYRGRDTYGAWAAILVFLAIHNLTESINIFGSFTNLSFYLIVFRLAIVRPDAPDFDDPGSAVPLYEAARVPVLLSPGDAFPVIH